MERGRIRLSPSTPKTNALNPDAWRMRERLSTAHGRSLYDQRKQTIEPVFGQIKEIRGIRRFRLRGLAQVECEWDLICATHNLLKLFRYRTGRLPRVCPAAASSASRQAKIGLIGAYNRRFKLICAPTRRLPPWPRPRWSRGRRPAAAA